MSNFGRYNGDLMITTLDGTPISFSTNDTLNVDQNLIDTTNKDSERWVENVRGNRSWSIDVEGMMDHSASYGTEQLLDLIISGADAVAVFKIRTSDEESGDVRYSGTINLANLTQNSPHNDAGTFSGTLQGTGPLTKTTV